MVSNRFRDTLFVSPANRTAYDEWIQTVLQPAQDEHQELMQNCHLSRKQRKRGLKILQDEDPAFHSVYKQYEVSELLKLRGKTGHAWRRAEMFERQDGAPKDENLQDTQDTGSPKRDSWKRHPTRMWHKYQYCT